MARAPRKTKPINLALQGGGSHGALTWGVLDRVLEDDRLEIVGISGTSAGAMNAVVMADGLAAGGRDRARAGLERFWKAVSDAALFSPFQRSPLDKMLGNYSLDHSPGYLFFEGMSRMFSPYDLNPLGLNPLRGLLAEHVDFDRINAMNGLRVHVAATNVRTGRSRVFGPGELGVEPVLASACLPQMFPAVEIGGEFYWDGGFTGNPALYPLLSSLASPDIIVVQINPLVRHEAPRSAREIMNRVNEISFNSSLVKELRAIGLMQRVAQERNIDLGVYTHTYLHLIHTYVEVQDLVASSKLNAEWGYLRKLYDLGRGWAEEWLAQNYDHIGERSTLDLDSLEGDAHLPAPPSVPRAAE
ncbi:patatin-like phospholipase family protein [Tabrizicola sp. J26]|uniref:patatin-like phospholipase family protein n=1 Tax=Alitabrizicola rongguiensis TaxID=2909234 RepID=UPI001F21161A|nr:patatin-like phospholipase family protein [Tabrizicola rongguiensis]MCF1709086.1 patatin-like phospholipase family protein [Tabrizicola rongguiensis]